MYDDEKVEKLINYVVDKHKCPDEIGLKPDEKCTNDWLAIEPCQTCWKQALKGD